MHELTTPYSLLGQDQPPPLPGEPASPGTLEDGSPTGGGAPSGGQPFGTSFFLIMLALLLGMIVFSVFGQRRDKKRRAAMISAIKKRDRVQTVGGVIGSIVEVKPDVVVLKVDESSNTRITFSRSSVQQVLSSQAAGGENSAEDT